MTTTPDHLDQLARFARAQRIAAAFRIARESRHLAPPTYFPHRMDAELPLCPRFPTGLRRLDQLTGGGVYGVTTIAGAPKVGKSHLAVACAWEAAAEGARVAYLSADQAIEQTLRLMGRYCAGRVSLQSDEVRQRVNVIDVVTPMPSAALVETIGSIAFDDSPLVVVVDSLNSLAQLLGGDFFTMLHGLLYSFVRARRLAQDDLTVVAIAELNKGGDVKGRQAIYASDLVVRVQRAAGGAAELDVQYSRESGSGKAGRYLLDHERARFVPIAEEFSCTPRF